jgi:hypothetical protein
LVITLRLYLVPKPTPGSCSCSCFRPGTYLPVPFVYGKLSEWIAVSSTLLSFLLPIVFRAFPPDPRERLRIVSSALSAIAIPTLHLHSTTRPLDHSSITLLLSHLLNPHRTDPPPPTMALNNNNPAFAYAISLLPPGIELPSPKAMSAKDEVKSTIIKVNVVFLSLVGITCACRCYVRLWMVRNFGWDDGELIRYRSASEMRGVGGRRANWGGGGFEG